MFVYIVKCLSVDFIKIGISDNPQRRLTELQHNSPYAVEIALLIECADATTAQQLEGLLHALMNGSRSNGEWFHASVNTAIRFAHSILFVSGKICLSGDTSDRQTSTPDKRITTHDWILEWLKSDPSRLLLSLREAQRQLRQIGIIVSHTTVNRIRHELTDIGKS